MLALAECWVRLAEHSAIFMSRIGGAANDES
jgi:hypothetical protein